MSAYDNEISLRLDNPPGAGGEEAAGGEPAAYEREITYAGRFSEDWLVGPAVNGGVVMALGLAGLSAAMRAAGADADVIAFSAVFPSASAPGPVEVLPEVLRIGRRISTGAVRVVQTEPHGAGGTRRVERIRLLATHADLAQHSEPLHRQADPPAMPPPEECIPATREVGSFAAPIAILDRIDLRLDPATAGFGVGAPTGAGELRGWIRFVDGRDPDAASLPFFLDAFPPVTFDLGAYAWAPTLEFSGHVRARPAPGWLRVRTTTTNVAGGLFEEDCVLWDATDRVVAQSRQLAGVRMPESPPAEQAPVRGAVADGGGE